MFANLLKFAMPENAEFASGLNYLFRTVEKNWESKPLDNKRVMVLGRRELRQQSLQNEPVGR